MKKIIILLILTALAGTSCFYKSVMTGEADEINQARIYNFNEKNYLVTMEYVFQAVYKEGGRGINITSGYNDQRISVYNLEDGSLKARKNTGRIDRYPILFLGCSKDHLWFYSPSNGLHTLDPENLEMKLTHDQIMKNNPELGSKLAACEWYQLQQYFQFNDITQNVVVTDNQGYRYFLDIGTLNTKKNEGEYLSFNPRRDRQLETNISFPPPRMSMTGDLRKQIRIDNREVNGSLTFLDGKFMVERDPVRLLTGISEQLTTNKIQMEALNNQLSQLNSTSGGSGPDRRFYQQNFKNRLNNSRQKTENLINELEKALTDISLTGFSHHYSQPLSPDSTSFFVFHSAGTAKEANLRISRIRRTGSVELKELWTTELNGIFYNPDAARETNVFKEVFSKGNPGFRFSQFEMEDNKLVMIWMLHLICINMDNGKLLYQFRL